MADMDMGLMIQAMLQGLSKKDAEDISKTPALVNEFTENTKEFSENTFFSAVCMIMEEGCKQRGIDVVKMARLVAESVKDINEEMGRY